ncbi:transcription elongation factor SPT4 [Paraphaeosphaeria sporulosa]|uniref:Transcription elongation factor SPT4 n=1 Tax=Paraphaeosphaeria sporulosa TaxID=1460663 RepID=A0A177C4M1_9PLEO|nr:transcription elongation factor SPT4 [Paraphaeosphaeria sporulosa]OAG01822.1 transcription elongation factor SPT4 [Paraphaeosphaeria sporulosa]
MANANNFVPTNQLRNLRACMVCSIVKTENQFKSQGCPNCESFLQLRGEDEQVRACTSQVFEGLITVSNTTKSWVARWQRLEGYVPGVYAVQVEGLLPEDVISAAEDAGVHYIPRDGSVNEALPTDA